MPAKNVQKIANIDNNVVFRFFPEYLKRNDRYHKHLLKIKNKGEKLDEYSYAGDQNYKL